MKKTLKGFTLIELMIVVAIIAILAAIAIPAYQGYIRVSKENASRDNFDAAHRLVKNEDAKAAAGGSQTPSFIAALNEGDKKSPFDPGADAFVTGGCTATDGGDVNLEYDNLAAVPAATSPNVPTLNVQLCDDTNSYLLARFPGIVTSGIDIPLESG